VLPFPDDSFDAIVARLVFGSGGESDQGLAEVRRVLRPAGHLLLLITHLTVRAEEDVFTDVEQGASA